MAVMAPFTESGLTVRIVDTPEDREQAFRLRHAVYCQRLHWVPPRPDGREHDGYDEGSTTVAVFAADGRILGLVRFIPPGRPFMLESDFCRLLTPGYRLYKGPDSAEVTRLTTLSAVTDGSRALPVAGLLYKAIYRWACARQVRFLYLVVETRYFHHLRRRGLPCAALGPPQRFGAGPPCVAALLDRALFEREAAERPTRFRLWLKADAAAFQGPPPSRPPGRDCAHSASAWRCRDETGPSGR